MNELDRMLMTDYSMIVYANNSADTNTTAMLASLNAEKAQLEGILNIITGEMNTYLASKCDFYYTLQPNYGVTNVYNWKGYNFIAELDNEGVEDDVTYVNESSFTCLNDHTSEFTPYFPVSASEVIPESGSVTEYPSPSGCLVIDCGIDGIVYAYITDSAYPSGGANTTTVNISGGEITSNIKKVSIFDSYYSHTPEINWDSDSYIDQRVDEFSFIYDHLNHSLDTTGTYGINAKIASLTAGASTITSNKTKLDKIHDTYLRFTSWSMLASASDVSYIDDVTFLCSGGDYTENFPISGAVLIDCDTDGFVGGYVINSEYITKMLTVKLAPDFNKIESSNENYLLDNTLSDVYIDSLHISDFIFVDVNTIKVSYSYIDLFIENAEVTCTMSDREVYYTVLSAEITDDGENYTKVKYGQGLPITENITGVYVQ